MSVRSSLQASISHKCAECHEGDLFRAPISTLEQPFEMHDRCPVCNANYMPEPGFYYGAMFTSYFLSGFITLGLVMFLHWVVGWSLTACFFILVGVVALAYVWWFRFSRALWLNMMVRFQPGKARRILSGQVAG